MNKSERRIDWDLIDDEIEQEIDFQEYMEELDRETTKDIEHIEREWTK